MKLEKHLNNKNGGCGMRYIWLDDYLMARPGVTKDFKPEWNWIRYQIGGKLFAAVCLNSQDRAKYITLKLTPDDGAFLRQKYDDIIPGYYMNKVHWNSVDPDGAVPGQDVPLVAQVQQGPVVSVSPEDDIPSFAPVAPVRPAVGLVFGPAHVCGAPASLARAAIDFHVVYKVRIGHGDIYVIWCSLFLGQR